MTRTDFLSRLAAIGKTQADIASACRVKRTSVYCWGHGDAHPFPAYVVSLIEAWEEIERLQDAIDARIARERIAELDASRGVPAEQPGNPGRLTDAAVQAGVRAAATYRATHPKINWTDLLRAAGEAMLEGKP